MKLNVEIELKDLNGEVIKEGEKAITLKTVVVNALTMMGKGDDSLSGQDKFALYTIAQTVHKGGEVELTIEEIAKIKERVGKFFTPMIVGNVYSILEQKD